MDFHIDFFVFAFQKHQNQTIRANTAQSDMIYFLKEKNLETTVHGRVKMGDLKFESPVLKQQYTCISSDN